MTALAPDSTPDSRSGTVTAGQALPPLPPKWADDTLAIVTFAAWHRITDDILSAWNAQDTRSRVRWRATAEATAEAIAAAAPADGVRLSESQQFQVSEARDILRTWDLSHTRGIGRETVLADQVRTLLAIVDAQPQAAPGADAVPFTCPVCSATLNRCWSCGTDTRKAGQ